MDMNDSRALETKQQQPNTPIKLSAGSFASDTGSTIISNRAVIRAG